VTLRAVLRSGRPGRLERVLLPVLGAEFCFRPTAVRNGSPWMGSRLLWPGLAVLDHRDTPFPAVAGGIREDTAAVTRRLRARLSRCGVTKGRGSVAQDQRAVRHQNVLDGEVRESAEHGAEPAFRHSLSTPRETTPSTPGQPLDAVGHSAAWTSVLPGGNPVGTNAARQAVRGRKQKRVDGAKASVVG
jgi:hypothetical protein